MSSLKEENEKMGELEGEVNALKSTVADLAFRLNNWPRDLSKLGQEGTI